MAVKVTKPAVNLRSELPAAKAGGAVRATDQDFWTQGDGTTTTFAVQKGWTPKRVFVGGAIMRPGTGNDYEVSFDGFTYSIVFAVAPAAVPICITAEVQQ